MAPRRPALAIALSLAATIVLGVLWQFAAAREGSRGQPLSWDSAGFYADALVVKRCIEGDGVRGFCHAWVHVSPDHTPLVPAASALLMFAFGESPAAAQLVLPISTFVFVLSILGAVRRLYPEAHWTPFATAAFLCTFPAILNQSRMYLFEYPLAAAVAATCWAMLATERFTRLVPSLTFGALAGIAALARAGSPALLAGPCIVYAVVALRDGPRARKLANLGIAAIIGIALSATWYLPNWGTFFDYIHLVTYGDQAELFAGGRSALSFGNALYTLQWYLVDGAGLPAAALALLCYAGACLRARRLVVSGTMVALLLAFAIDYVPVILVAQRAGGVLLLAAMGIQALAIVRAIAIVPRPRFRLAAGLLLALIALHHLVAMTFTFPVGRDRSGAMGPFEEQGFPLWNHRNLHLEVVGPARNENRWGEWMSQIVDRIEKLPVAFEPRDTPLQICFNADNPIFQVYNLRIEGMRRRHNWHGIQLFWLPPDAARARQREIQDRVLAMDVLVNRTNRPPTPYDQVVAILTGPLLEGRDRRFVEAPGGPVRLGNGDEYTIYQRTRDGEIGRVGEIPAGATPWNAAFIDPAGGGKGLRFEAYELLRDGADGGRLWGVRLYAVAEGAPDPLPDVLLTATGASGDPPVAAVHSSERYPGKSKPADQGTRHLRIDLVLEGRLPADGVPADLRLSVEVRSRLTGAPWDLAPGFVGRVDGGASRAFLADSPLPIRTESSPTPRPPR